MTTSLGSTPRGSSASNCTSARGSTASEERKNSELSFQEYVSQYAQEPPKKRNSRPKVSAAPEMSVISEHSTNSNDESIKSSRSKIVSTVPFIPKTQNPPAYGGNFWNQKRNKHSKSFYDMLEFSIESFGVIIAYFYNSMIF